MKSVRIADALYAEAEAAASIMHRSIAMQLEHWAYLGQKLEAAHMNEVKRLAGGEDLTLRAAKKRSQQNFASAVRRGDLANTAGMFFSRTFFNGASVDTGKPVL